MGESFYIGAFSCSVLDGDRPHAGSDRIREAIRVEFPTIEGSPPVVRAIAESSASVLVFGETGVGKEVLSQTIHHFSRRVGPCLRINCAALPESLLESELFGHEKGAFTGAARQRIGLLEAANGGTAFLDEIGELAPSLQAKFLRALEAGEVTRVGAVKPTTIDVRFVAATHRDLAAEVSAGRFRADLYYRLDGITLVIPPLRSRREQIVPLALQFIARAQVVRGRELSVKAEFLSRLESHDWPGNVRELKATVERAVLLAAGADLAPSHIVFSKRVNPSLPGSSEYRDEVPISSSLEAAALSERTRIVDALRACAGNQTRAAKRLGMSRATLTTKLTLYQIPRPRL